MGITQQSQLWEGEKRKTHPEPTITPQGFASYSSLFQHSKAPSEIVSEYMNEEE
jgi:hypothetical protein